MNVTRVPTLVLISALCFCSALHAQKPPELGYMFPPGGKAGTTIDVRLAGYDWTPDMEFFVHDPRVKLVPSGPIGPILIPGPPYWFGAKGRLAQPPLPREIPAKLTIPADVPPGPIFWQAANASGTTSTGTFIVGNGPEVVEEEKRKTAQVLPSLPMTVSGRISKIEEVDRYRFTVAKDGPITIDLMARRLGANFLGVLEVRDAKGEMVADLAGTSGVDPCLTFAAKAGASYEVSIHDVDFGGDRCYVYRLTITPGPRVVAAIPAAGKRGETREVEFVGIGVATGASKLESVKRPVAFPAIPAAAFDYRLETPSGIAPPYSLHLSDLPETVAAPVVASGSSIRTQASKLTLPVGVNGVLDQAGAEDRFAIDGKKGDVWSLSLEARRFGSPLDVSLAILNPEGKEVARNEDLPLTTDAGLDFTVPADGTYHIAVSDVAGQSGTRAATYRLVVRPVLSDFTLTLAAQHVNVPIGGKFDLAIKATRKAGFKMPIALTVKGLPAGVSVPPGLVIPGDKTDLPISLTAAKDAAALAGLITIEGSATVGTAAVTRPALAKAAGNLTPHSPEEGQTSTILLATAIKAPFKGRPVDQDTGRKVHRGTTFPADVIVERLDGFNGEIILQMAARQSYQVHGITGGDVIVPPGVGQTIYPCYMPEWLETSRTSRLGMIAVAKLPDGKGKVRHVVGEITGFVTATMEGALLKLSHEDRERTLQAGQPFEVRLKIARLAKLTEPVRLELRLPEEVAGQLSAEPIVVPAGKEEVVFRIVPAATLRGELTFTIRATALQDGKYPVISETSVFVEFQPAAAK